MNRLTKLLLTSLILLVLSACGGGGGSIGDISSSDPLKELSSISLITLRAVSGSGDIVVAEYTDIAACFTVLLVQNQKTRRTTHA